MSPLDEMDLATIAGEVADIEEKHIQWRIEQVMAFGFSRTDVIRAIQSSNDYGLFMRLVEEGCHPALALEIVR